MKYLLLLTALLFLGCSEDEPAFTIYAYSTTRSADYVQTIENEAGERYATLRKGDRAIEVGLDDNIIYLSYEGSNKRTAVLIEDGRHYWIYSDEITSVTD